MGVMAATIRKKRLPLAPAEQRAVLAGALWIAALGKQPPAVCHAKGDLREGGRQQTVIDDDNAARAEQVLATCRQGQTALDRCRQVPTALGQVPTGVDRGQTGSDSCRQGSDSVRQK